ncbi:hypothetical protein K443DRAFT_99968, partial [Laccaria amethystina LaAM-08-1]
PDAHVADEHTLSLTSWNNQASQSRPAARSELILDHIFKGPKFPPASVSALRCC